MEVGIQLRGSYDQVKAAAKWAESAGLAAMALPDHYLAGTDPTLPAYDHLLHFAGLARETKTIELVDLVSPITFRHPAVYAKSAVTLAEMSNERFVLGLGTGWLEDEHRLFGLDFPDQSTRFRLLEEALGYVRAFVAGEAFAGQHFRIEAFDSAPRPRFKIVVGGSGPKKTPDLTGRFADEFNMFPGKAGDVADRVNRCRQSAVAAGRDPTAIMLSYTTPAFAGLDQSSYQEHMGREASQRSIDVPELERRLGRRGIPFGWGAQLAEALEPIRTAGVSRVYVQATSADIATLSQVVGPYMELVH